MPGSTSSSRPDGALWAVVLAGGIGSRFWPVSTPRRPKQLLALAGDDALIVQTVRRIEPVVPVERVRVLTGEGLVEPIRSVLPGLTGESFLVEPRARGTAPVLAWAAHELVARDPDALMVSLHADAMIEPAAAFVGLVEETAAFARAHDRLYTIGVAPDRPETGYGYIRLGEPLDAALGAFEVDSFVEKPDRATAEDYLRGGRHLWNSGIFLWKAAFFLEQIRRFTPELAELLPLLDDGDVAGFFERAPNLSVDQGVLERSDAVAVVRSRFRWDDVGAWDAVARTLAADDAGNVAHGAVHAVDAERSIAWSDAGDVVLFGVRDLVVVRTGDVTLVMPRDRAADLKTLLERLPDRLREIE